MGGTGTTTIASGATLDVSGPVALTRALVNAGSTLVTGGLAGGTGSSITNSGSLELRGSGRRRSPASRRLRPARWRSASAEPAPGTSISSRWPRTHSSAGGWRSTRPSAHRPRQLPGAHLRLTLRAVRDLHRHRARGRARLLGAIQPRRSHADRRLLGAACRSHGDEHEPRDRVQRPHARRARQRPGRHDRDDLHQLHVHVAGRRKRKRGRLLRRRDPGRRGSERRHHLLRHGLGQRQPAVPLLEQLRHLSERLDRSGRDADGAVERVQHDQPHDRSSPARRVWRAATSRRSRSASTRATRRAGARR